MNFSTSKGGRANVLDGLKLVQWFLRVVAIKKPKYWLMENVPRVALHLPDEIPYSWIGLDVPGVLPIANRMHFNTADFGVPQSRTRYLVGNYPLPKRTYQSTTAHTDLLSDASNLPNWKTLGDVLRILPDPRRQPSDGVVRDPNYAITLESDRLTDHFVRTTLDDGEAESIRDAKTNHPYMGRMAFPDDVDRPARTVVATQLGRETLVIREGENSYRRATVRECACLQSFPITYQFTGNSISSRYRQAGDAVPPLLAFAIAREINLVAAPELRTCAPQLSTPIAQGLRKRTRNVATNPLRKFCAMIPGKEVRGSRVELDNLNQTRFANGSLQPSSTERIWSARLHLGEGKGKARAFAIPFSSAFGAANALFALAESDWTKRWDAMCSSLKEWLEGDLPSAEEMQGAWAGYSSSDESPERYAAKLTTIVDNQFPKDMFFDRKVKVSLNGESSEPISLRVRLLVALVATSAFVDCLYDRRAVLKILVRSRTRNARVVSGEP